MSKKLKIVLKPSQDRNDLRRLKYREDEDYKTKVKESARLAYVKKNKLERTTCSRALEFYLNLAKREHVVAINNPKWKKSVELPVLNVPKTAIALEQNHPTFWRWIKRNMVPEPALVISHNNQKVYHVDEVRVLIEEISKHQKMFAYYRSNHITLRDRIFKRISEVRKQLGI